MKNNFDKSSTGTDIEAVAYYDAYMSQSDFNENFEILQHSDNRKNSILYYTDCGNVKNDVTFDIAGDKDAKVKFLAENISFDASEIETWDDNTLRNEIYGQLTEWPQLINFEKLNDELTDSGLEIAPSKELVKVISHGYSQGDYSEIYYCPADLQEAWGSAPIETDLKETFDHLLWDAPIWAQVTINGDEYNYYDCPEYDQYEFKRDEFLAYVSEKSGVGIEKIAAILPKEPSYNQGNDYENDNRSIGSRACYRRAALGLGDALMEKLGFSNMSVRFFIWQDQEDYASFDKSLVEVSEADFLEADGPIEYERHSVFANGVSQICLTKGTP